MRCGKYSRVTYKDVPMRIVGLFALTIFFPVFAHASIIITEVMYDMPGTEGGGEHDWVEVFNAGEEAVDISSYRFFEAGTNHTLKLDQGSATLPSGGYAVIASATSTFLIDWPSFNGTLFDSSFNLNSMGELIGIRVDSSDTTSDFTYSPIEVATDNGSALQRVSVSGTSFVAGTPSPGTGSLASSSSGSLDTSLSPDPSSTTLTATAPSSLSSSPPEYIPIPTLRIITSGARTISSGADTAFTAVIYDGKGNKRDDATVTWSFGDGMRRIGASVFHAYYSPGEYIVVVRATTSDGGDVFIESVMTVKDVSIKIASVSTRGIALANNSSRTLDLSLWRLSMGGKEFKIPTGTQILAGRTTLLPSQIIDLPVSGSASLLYPSGEVAASYSETLAAVSAPLTQPFVSKTSFNKVQAVEPVINTKTNIQTYGKAVLAPTAATEIAAVGAAFPASPEFEQELASAADGRVSGIFSSPWTLGFLGVMVLAGTAFILL